MCVQEYMCVCMCKNIYYSQPFIYVNPSSTHTHAQAREIGEGLACKEVPDYGVMQTCLVLICFTFLLRATRSCVCVCLVFSIV